MATTYENAMRSAIRAAEQFLGNTAPNPPVGAVALDSRGKVLLVAAHEKAGTPHAEAKLLGMAESSGMLAAIETLVVTLEPCNHYGRTPPCTDAILAHKNIRRVVLGAKDPNPRVAGGGIARLRAAGLEVVEGVLEKECRHLIRAFAKWASRGRPYVVIKAAFRADGSMIPPAGRKTFTSEASLVFAHELRRQSDALWTGSGTVLADGPEFTVRRVPDHPGRQRHLLVSDRRGRVPEAWQEAARKRGFLLHFPPSFEEGLDYLGKNGVLQVLVEAGPALRNAWLQSGLWDESVVINQGKAGDEITVEFRDALEAGKEN